MTRTLAAATFAAILAAPAATAADETILPGHWEATYSVMGFGRTERWCIQLKDIGKFMRGPSNHIYTCTYPVNVAQDGAFRFQGECRSRKGRHAFVSGEGTYTPTTVRMKIRIKGGVKLAGIPITVRPSMRAHRLGDACPPEAKAFK